MYAGYPRSFAEPRDDLCRDLDAGGLRILALETLHPLERRLVDLDAGDVVVHVLEHAGAARRGHADKERRPLRNPGRQDRLEPLLESVDVVDDVRLEADGAGLELLLEPLGAVAQRVGRSEDEEVRRDRELLAGGKAAVVELADEARQPE